MARNLLAVLLLCIFLSSSALQCIEEGHCSLGKRVGEITFYAMIENELFSAERILPASTYYDKALGNWIGQMIGNILGLPTEGRFIQTSNPEYIAYYSSLPEGSFTDDDTSMEWVFLHMLEEHGLGITYSQVRKEWMEHINQAIWVANARARGLMDEGYVPPETGSKEHNEDWGAIDAQIECELFGVILPGMGDEAYDMAKWFARITNDDYAVEAAAFYATLFSYAFFESDVSALVEMALAKIPNTSLTWAVVSDITKWHREYSDWRETRNRIWEKYGSYGWVSSPLNLASVVMALLYGNGDFDLSLMIAVAAGWDNDCNAATTGGLLGTIVGESNIHDRWKEPLMNLYRNTNRDNLPSDTISNIASRTQVIAEKAILAYGGAILENATGKIYVIQTDLPQIKLPSNSPSDENLARRHSATPVCHDKPFTPDFSVELEILNDGVVKNQRAYALKSQNVGEEDWWGYTFGETLEFNQLVYYQGDVSSEGGWWETLTVQYRNKMGRWVNATGLKITPSYDFGGVKSRMPYARFVLSFDNVEGTGIRVYGKPVASGGYTSVAELEVFYGGSDGETPPSRPVNLRVTMLEGQEALLEWVDASENECGFIVKRREFWLTEYEEIATLGTNIERYIDSGTQSFRLYYYIVVAVNSVGGSDPSNEASLFTLMAVGLNVQSYVLFIIILAAIIVLTLMKTGRLKIGIVQRRSWEKK